MMDYYQTENSRMMPAAMCDLGEHRQCYDCGADLAGKQAHFNRSGDAFCVACASLPRCRYCDERVEKYGYVHAGGCGNIG
jgi:hypothetical protein